jgi:H+-transporting ATPase
VNDAPALKKADCGIAVSGATDAARAAAAIVLTTPGLSVIIDAIKESRKIFQRMQSYAIYRIAETLGVLSLMTLAILIFNFYPLTAVMIVMLALLNDGAILSIAYDNVHYSNKPEAWNMRLVLGVATVVSIIGLMDAFGLFYIGERVFHLDRSLIQTLMYLKLSVGGHLKIFITRTRGPFWSIRPAPILLVAVFGTQIVATLIAVYGLFMPPIGWGWALMVWGYSLPFFLINDRVKLLAYRIFDPVKAEPKPEAKAKTTSDLTPQIATRAYELYEQQGRRDGQSVQNWDKAEQEIRKDQAKTEPKPEIKVEPKPEAKAKPQPEAKVEAKSETKAEPQPKIKTEPEPEVKEDSKPETKADPKTQAKPDPEPKAEAEAKPTVEPQPESKIEPLPKAEPEPATKVKPPSDVSPQLVKRVHKFYEQLGREDVRAVQESEAAEQKIPEAETKKISRREQGG